MSAEFRPVPLTKLPIDAYKHVRFVDGMVLGVDDFEQEFAYLSERDKLLMRMLVGYGTVRGLRVFARNEGTADAEIVVSAGLGISPTGDVVRVPVDQCARLKDWIDSEGIVPTVTAPNPVLVVYVTAEYASRTSDPVPIPGEPCRVEEELLTDSRVADGFRLELSLEAPAQPEEDAATAYLAWLDGLSVDRRGNADMETFLSEIRRAAWEKSTAAPTAPAGAYEPRVFSSHPRAAGGADLELSRRDAWMAQLVALGRIGDVRALSAVLEATATGEPPRAGGVAQARLLLARVTIPMVRTGPVATTFELSSDPAAKIQIDTTDAPRLASLRYLLRTVQASLERVARSAVSVPARAGRRYIVAAAGQVKVARNAAAAQVSPNADTVGGVHAWADGTDNVIVTFQGLDIRSSQYVVKVLAVADPGVNPSVVMTGTVSNASDRARFTLRVTGLAGPADLTQLTLNIEVGAVVDDIPSP